MPDVHIVIDCRFAAYHGGLGRYTRELTRALLSLHSQDRFTVLVHAGDDRGWLKDVTVPFEAVKVRAEHYSFAEQCALPPLLLRLRPGVFFCPHFNVPFFCPVPFVATVHDLILHRFPNNASFAKRMAYRILMARCIARARTIVCPSAFVAAEIADCYGRRTEKKKVRVVREGIDAAFTPQSAETVAHVRAKYGLERPFFLCVGNAKEHKNVPLLLQAFSDAHPEECDLVLVSGGKEADALRLPPHTRMLHDVPDTDLPALYSGARAFVTASLYEGFCLPVAEALACGCPVIAANTSAIPELVARNGLLIEATLEAFTQAFTHPPSPIAPVRSGTWQEAAKETLTILHGIR